MANFYVIVEINDPRNGGKGRWEGWNAAWPWHTMQKQGFVTEEGGVTLRNVALINGETGERKDVK